jgi:ATP-dependent Lhr-like helicase
VALFLAVKRGELDRLIPYENSLDVLAQQIVAEASSREWREDDLYGMVRKAWPYRDLSREAFDAVVRMLAEGFTTRKGRRSGLVHRDEVQGRILAKRSARLTALTSGGAIPDAADYRVVLDPDETFLGTLNEDFAIESNAGDIFQLGNSSWRILQVAEWNCARRRCARRAADHSVLAWRGAGPHGGALGRSSAICAPASSRSCSPTIATARCGGSRANPPCRNKPAEQVVDYLAASLRILGALPTLNTIILERFFDDSGGMQLVLHAPFGSRVNRAWALALRKRFCRQFNFELQAAATEEGLVLSLSDQHAFPLADVFRYLHPASVKEILIQAFLDAPVFKTRWRWNATVSLAVARMNGGKKVPAPLQRMRADDLLASAFP